MGKCKPKGQHNIKLSHHKVGKDNLQNQLAKENIKIEGGGISRLTSYQSMFSLEELRRYHKD